MTVSSDATPAMSSHPTTTEAKIVTPVAISNGTTLRCSSSSKEAWNTSSYQRLGTLLVLGPRQRSRPLDRTLALHAIMSVMNASNVAMVGFSSNWPVSNFAGCPRPRQARRDYSVARCRAMPDRILSLKKESDHPDLVNSRVLIQFDSPRGGRNVCRHPIATPCYWIRTSVSLDVQAWTLLQPCSDQGAVLK